MWAKHKICILLALRRAVQSCSAQLLWRKLSRKWVCVYTGPPAPTYHQSIMSMQGYMESSTLLQHLWGAWRCGKELNLASACLQRLRNCVTPSIQSLRQHFWIKHKFALAQCVLWKNELRPLRYYEQLRLGKIVMSEKSELWFSVQVLLGTRKLWIFWLANWLNGAHAMV